MKWKTFTPPPPRCQLPSNEFIIVTVFQDEGRQPITVEVWEPVEMARDETTLSDEDEALPAAQTRENRVCFNKHCYIPNKCLP